MSGNGFSGEKKWEEDGTDVILHMQLPHSRAEALRKWGPHLQGRASSFGTGQRAAEVPLE